jgi:hypothetical protein
MCVPSSLGERPADVGRLRRLTTRLRHAVRRRRWLLLVLIGLIAAAVAVACPHLRAWYHLRAARAELQRYHHPQAIRHLQICRAVWPRHPDVLLLAARAARRARVYGDTALAEWPARGRRALAPKRPAPRSTLYSSVTSPGEFSEPGEHRTLIASGQNRASIVT